MRRKGAAIIQRNGGFCGVTLTFGNRQITDLQVYEAEDLPEVRQALGEGGYGVAVENGSAYLFNLTFPFSDKRKIRMVIGGEIEERMPLPVDDLTLDFVETAKGHVLAAAIPRSLPEELGLDKHVRITTVQAIAELHPCAGSTWSHTRIRVPPQSGKATIAWPSGTDALVPGQFFDSPGPTPLTAQWGDQGEKSSCPGLRHG